MRRSLRTLPHVTQAEVRVYHLCMRPFQTMYICAYVANAQKKRMRESEGETYSRQFLDKRLTADRIHPTIPRTRMDHDVNDMLAAVAGYRSAGPERAAFIVKSLAILCWVKSHPHLSIICLCWTCVWLCASFSVGVLLLRLLCVCVCELWDVLWLRCRETVSVLCLWADPSFAWTMHMLLCG